MGREDFLRPKDCDKEKEKMPGKEGPAFSSGVPMETPSPLPLPPTSTHPHLYPHHPIPPPPPSPPPPLPYHDSPLLLRHVSSQASPDLPSYGPLILQLHPRHSTLSNPIWMTQLQRVFFFLSNSAASPWRFSVLQDTGRRETGGGWGGDYCWEPSSAAFPVQPLTFRPLDTRRL